MVLHEGLRRGGRAAVVADLAPEVARRVGVDARAAEPRHESPLTFSASSRISSAGRRNRGPRASRRLAGSRSSSSRLAAELCRYVALVTISRMRCFTSQPLSTNSTASQSSSSGWLGYSP